MDGVVIYVSKDRSRAIIWCADQGPLGLARRDAMPPASQPPLVVGELVRFDAFDDCGTRLCGRLTRVAAPAGVPVSPQLPALLLSEARAAQRRAKLTLVSNTPGPVALKDVAVNAL